MRVEPIRLIQNGIFRCPWKTWIRISFSVVEKHNLLILLRLFIDFYIHAGVHFAPLTDVRTCPKNTGSAPPPSLCLKSKSPNSPSSKLGKCSFRCAGAIQERRNVPGAGQSTITPLFALASSGIARPASVVSLLPQAHHFKTGSCHSGTFSLGGMNSSPASKGKQPWKFAGR